MNGRRIAILVSAALISAATSAWLLAACDRQPPAPQVSTLVPGAVMHGVEGLALADDGSLYGASFFGQAIYRIDPKTGRVDVVVGPPEGEADDVAVGPAGTPAAGILAWTSVESVGVLRPGGKPEVLMAHAPRANPIAFNKQGRLFFSQSGTPDNELWELDPLGQKPPRLVTKGQGPLNGFGFGPDGRLYAPLFGTDKAVAVDIASGAYVEIGKGIGSPAAVKPDANGDLVSVDYKKGDVWHMDTKTGVTRLIATLREPVDNLAVTADGIAYVSNPADSSIFAVNIATGAVSDVVKGRFNTPVGMAMTVRDGKPALLVAQPMGFAYVDPVSGQIARPVWDNGRNGSASLAVDDKTIVTAVAGRLRKFDRARDAMVAETKELKTPSGIVIAKDDAVLVADTDGGRVVTWTEAGFTPVAEGLAQPTALALESPTVLLVAESAAGQIVRIDLASGRRSVIAKGLDRPMGLAVLADGRIAVAEPGKGTVAAIAPKTGARSALAANLPLSLAGLRVAQNMPVGLAVGADGTLYVACPADNSLVKIAFAK